MYWKITLSHIIFWNYYPTFFYFQNSASLTDSGISESGDNECEEALLLKLRSLAQDLQQQLTPKSNIIQEITQVRNVAAVLTKNKTWQIFIYSIFMICSLDLSWIRKNVFHICIGSFSSYHHIRNSKS